MTKTKNNRHKNRVFEHRFEEGIIYRVKYKKGDKMMVLFGQAREGCTFRVGTNRTVSVDPESIEWSAEMPRTTKLSPPKAV